MTWIKNENSVETKVREARLFGHAQRESVTWMTNAEHQGKKTGRPQRRFKDVVKEDMESYIGSI